MNSRNQLEQFFKSLPGIGTKQSERLVTAILEKGPSFTAEMSQALARIHSRVRLCHKSFQYFESDDPSETLSPIERAADRHNTMLMVVEKDTDIDHIEKSGIYKGHYFVLGGLVPMIKSRTKEAIRINELLKVIHLSEAYLEEVILALAFTPEGDHTRLYLETKIHDSLNSSSKVKLSVLGRGLAFGSEIEYSDPATIGYALEHRISLE